MSEAAGGSAIRELLAVFGFGVDTSELKKGEGGLEDFAGKVKRIAAAVGAAFAIHEVSEWAESNVKAMADVEHAAARLGIATEDVQAYQFAARALGLESESLLNMMGRLQVTQQAAADGSQQAAHAFTQLGLSQKDLKGINADDLFTKVAEGISKQTDASKQAAIATALFGRSGRELLPLLKQGAAGIEELKQQFRDLGGGYSEDAIEASKKYERESAKLSVTLTVLKSKVMVQLLPILDRIAKFTMKIVQSTSELIKQSNLVRATFYVMGTAAAAFGVAMAIANAPILLATAAIAALILIVDDLLTMFEGGQSVTGDVIDAIFGKDAHVDIVESIKNSWVDIKNTFATLRVYAHEFFAELEKGQVVVRSLADAIGANALRKHFGFKPLGETKEEQEERKKKAQTVSDEAKDFYRRIEAVKHGRTYKAEGESDEQAELKANIIRYQNPGISPEYGPLPNIPGVSQGAPIQLTQHIHPSKGMDEKALGEHAAHAAAKVLKGEKRAAAATFQRKVAE